MIRFARRALGATIALGLLMSAPAPAQAEGTDSAQAESADSTESAQADTAENGQIASEATQAKTVRIMPLGDSITFGVGAPGHDSYRTDLYKRLTKAGLRVDFVGSQHSGTGPDRDNEGHPGWTITQISANIDRWLDTYTPDVILLHIGTNDMHKGLPNATEHLATLLDRIHRRAPGTQVFVAKVIGLGTVPGIAGQVSRTRAYNKSVARLVTERGTRFHLVDLSRIRNMDLHDRLHPNEYGFARMSWNWYRALEPTLNDTGKAWPSTGNPNEAKTATLCFGDKVTLPAYAIGCHRWYHNRPAGAYTARVWQMRINVNGKSGWYTAR
jgi:lysophospholipase L1-like esterase